MIKKLRAFLSGLPAVARVLAPIIAVLLIGFFLPRDTRFQYEFKEGQVWRYGDLYAPFDFTLYKTDAELQAERKKALAEVVPYYIREDFRARSAFENFEKEFEKQIRQEQSAADYQGVLSKKSYYKKVGKGILDIIYKVGLIANDSIIDHRDKSFVVNIVDGNRQVKRTLGNLFTKKSAYEFITDTLPRSPLRNPEFLLPVLEQSLIPNLIYSDSLTQKFKQQRLQQISPNTGSIKAGELILANNTRITADDYRKLQSLKRHYESGTKAKISNYMQLATNLLFVGGIILLLFQFARRYAPETYSRVGDVIMLFLWPVFFSLLSVFVVKKTDIDPLFIPFALIVLVARNFFPVRMTLMLYTIAVLLSTLILGKGFDFLFIQMIVGMVALVVGHETRNWSKFFVTIGLIMLTYFVGLILLNFVRTGDFHYSEWRRGGWLLLNGFLLLLAYPLIPLFGKLFGRLTNIQLAELSDYNHPLLKELSHQAPGTFQHSLQVANLAEAAADAIGADSLLVKVGALFHDVGKMKNPQYFTENQKGINPHDQLTAEESARIIIGHVIEGERLARKHSLPPGIIRFIKTHHGTSRVEYFYRTEVNLKGADAVDVSDFTYPGPKPKTKEEVILMLADSIEAASHSLKEPDEKSLNALIEKIVKLKKEMGQFDDSDITFEQFNRVIAEIKKRLHSIYHIRVEYPE